MNYYDSSNNINTFDGTSEYYYLATKDTNIILAARNISSSWSSSHTKPFTLTATYGNNDYRSFASISSNQFYMDCYNINKIK